MSGKVVLFYPSRLSVFIYFFPKLGKELSFYLDVISTFPDGLVVLNDDLTILWHNPAFPGVIGLESEVLESNFYTLFGNVEIQGRAGNLCEAV